MTEAHPVGATVSRAPTAAEEAITNGILEVLNRQQASAELAINCLLNAIGHVTAQAAPGREAMETGIAEMVAGLPKIVRMYWDAEHGKTS